MRASGQLVAQGRRAAAPRPRHRPGHRRRPPAGRRQRPPRHHRRRRLRLDPLPTTPPPRTRPTPEQRVATLKAALALIDGAPFSGVAARRYRWVDDPNDYLRQQIIVAIHDTVAELALTELHDPTTALEAIQKGLIGVRPVLPPHVERTDGVEVWLRARSPCVSSQHRGTLPCRSDARSRTCGRLQFGGVRPAVHPSGRVAVVERASPAGVEQPQ